MNSASANASDREALQKLREMVQDMEVAMVTTVTPDGALRSRPMFTREFEEDGAIWFFTSDDSAMADDLAAKPAVNVSYADPKKHRYISVTGNAAVLRDPDKAQELWSPMLSVYFPRGLEDPHLALLRVLVDTAEYWDAASTSMINLFRPTTEPAVPRPASPR